MPTAVSRVWAGEGNADGTPAYEKKPCGCKAKGLNGCWYSVCAASVPLVEAGYVDHSAPDKQEITKLVIAQYLTEIRDAGVDTLILGCTHYPLIKSMIGEFMGRNVVLVDPAKTAAHHLERILSERGLKADHPAGQAHFYVSDAPDGFVQTADLFLGEYKGGEVEQIAIDKY